jgi:hypothetical protein
MHYIKIQKIIAYEPKGETNSEIYREYMKKFPGILVDMQDFFRGYPKRIVQYHDLNVLFNFLSDFKAGRSEFVDPYIKVKMYF